MKNIITTLLLTIPGFAFSQIMHIDTTFNGTGTAVYIFSDDDAQDATIATDGKIIISGNTNGTPQGLLLLRINEDGTIDSTFGGDGFALGESNNTSYGSGNKVIIQPDGRIISNGRWNGLDGMRDLTFFRFNNDGSPDLTFGPEGRVNLDLGFTSYVNDLALQPDGKILFAGNYIDGDPQTIIGRLNEDGILDNTFGYGGYIFISGVTEDDGEHAFLLQPDGKIIFGGITEEDIYGNNDIKIYRFNSDGSLDASFGDAGVKQIDFYNGFERLKCLFLNSDGSIYAFSGLCSGAYATVLHKLHPDGSFDESFSLDGTLTYNLGVVNNTYESAASYVGNKIIFGGGTTNFNVMRLNADGSLDNSFFYDGETDVDIYDVSDHGHLVVPEANGRILTIGYTFVGLDRQFSAMRLAPDTLIVIDTTTEVLTEPIIFSDITISPNPAQNILTVNSVEPITGIEIISLNGDILISKLYPATFCTKSMDIESLQDGMYIVKIYNEKKYACKKIIISH